MRSLFRKTKSLPGRWTLPALALLFLYCACLVAIIQIPGNQILSKVTMVLCGGFYVSYIALVLVDLMIS